MMEMCHKFFGTQNVELVNYDSFLELESSFVVCLYLTLQIYIYIYFIYFSTLVCCLIRISVIIYRYSLTLSQTLSLYLSLMCLLHFGKTAVPEFGEFDVKFVWIGESLDALPA